MVSELFVSFSESCDRRSIQSDGAANQASSLTISNKTIIKDYNSSASRTTILLSTSLVSILLSIYFVVR